MIVTPRTVTVRGVTVHRDERQGATLPVIHRPCAPLERSQTRAATTLAGDLDSDNVAAPAQRIGPFRAQ
jgi:hypothetical protein